MKGIQFKGRAHSEIKGRHSPMRRRELFQRRNNREIHNEEIIIRPAVVSESLKFKGRSESTSKGAKCNLRSISFKVGDFKGHCVTVKSNSKPLQFT